MMGDECDSKTCSCNESASFEEVFKRWMDELEEQIESTHRSEMITAEDLSVIIY
jgi:hypothetical protein